LMLTFCLLFYYFANFPCPTVMANILWGHLRKDAGAWDCTPSTNPPLVPQDKTATSMRMLIHDTQSSLEKFSERLDRLMTRVDDCKCQVINANKLLENERDKMLTEMVDISKEPCWIRSVYVIL